MLSQCWDALCFHRAIWVREVQPGLVVADPWVALIRLALCSLTLVFFNWSCPWAKFSAVTLIVTLGLSLVRYYYSQRDPVSYSRLRWLLILELWLTTALGAGNGFHCFATPSDSTVGFLKNLLLASGIAAGAQAGLLDREMFAITCIGQGALVLLLCSHAEEVCQQGLLATQYSTAMTRKLIRAVAMVGWFSANIIHPYETSPLIMVPDLSESDKDGPFCVCVVRTLLVTFSFILPSMLMYMYEHSIIQWGMRNRQDVHPQGGGVRQGGAPHGVDGRMLLGSVLVTIVAGTFVWAALRGYSGI